jgi:hypothetical protein
VSMSIEETVFIYLCHPVTAIAEAFDDILKFLFLKLHAPL